MNMKRKKPGPLSRPRWLLLGTAISAGALVLAMGTAGATTTAGSGALGHGYNDPSTPTSLTVPESATVSAGAGSPRIECAWALPDANAKGGAETSNSTTSAANYTGPNGTDTPPSLTGTYAFNYYTAAPFDTSAQTPTTPSGTTPVTPCQLGYTGVPNTGSATQATGDTHMTQVLPNAFNTPAQRRIELWAAVDDTEGVANITKVYWDVYHPNGSLKVEVQGVKDTNCFGPYGTSTTTDPMFKAAIGTGQLSATAVNNATHGIIALCNEGVKQLWHNAFDVSKDQPNGQYKIVATAVGNGGAVATLTYYITILPFFDLKIDFSSVNYGSISPTKASIVAGDVTFSTATRPSVTNGGNSGEAIGLAFSPMIGTNLGKCINHFDAAFGTYGPTTTPTKGQSPALTPKLLQHLTTITATCPSTTSKTGKAAEVWFKGTTSQLLCPNDIGKLDLSIEPTKDTGATPADTYTGTLTVLAKSSIQTTGGCPTDNGAPYVPNSGQRL